MTIKRDDQDKRRGLITEENFIREYKNMKLVNHRYIVKVVDAVKISSEKFALLTDFCKHKSLE